MSNFEVKVHKAIVSDIPGADRIQACSPEGQDYQCVIQKGYLATGDLFVYIPESAIVPDWLLFEMGLLGALDGPQHNKVKAHKFRKTLSQGLAYVPPKAKEGVITSLVGLLSGNGYSDRVTRYWLRKATPEALERGFVDDTEFPEYTVWREGEDLAEYLGITKYEPKVPSHFEGVWTPSPNHWAVPNGSIFQSYTEIENIKHEPNLLQEGEEVVMREKLHGTCFIAYYRPAAGEKPAVFMVTSKGIGKRGFALLEEESNVYWQAARKWNIQEGMASICGSSGFIELMVFGEIIGVQDLKYGLQDGQTALYLFDAKFNRPEGVQGWVADDIRLANLAAQLNVPMCPLLYQGPWSKEKGQELSGGKSRLPGAEAQIREGLVVAPVIGRTEARAGRVKLKIVHADYLTRKDPNATEFE
jgi:RNA ligase (TIGR02306 family)